MTYRYVEPGLAQMLALSLDHILPNKTAEWKKNLDQNRLTMEMRDAFVAMGWLSSSRDSRLSDEPTVEVEVDEEAETEPVETREPHVKPGKPEKPESGTLTIT